MDLSWRKQRLSITRNVKIARESSSQTTSLRRHIVSPGIKNVCCICSLTRSENLMAPYRNGFAPIFPDICYHLTHYKPAAADIPVASDNPAHYADAIRYNARTPLQGSLLPLTRLVWA